MVIGKLNGFGLGIENHVRSCPADAARIRMLPVVSVRLDRCFELQIIRAAPQGRASMRFNITLGLKQLAQGLHARSITRGAHRASLATLAIIRISSSLERVRFTTQG